MKSTFTYVFAFCLKMPRRDARGTVNPISVHLLTFSYNVESGRTLDLESCSVMIKDQAFVLNRDTDLTRKSLWAT